MEELLKRKIKKIRELLENQCIIMASEFDHNYPEAIILEDPRGANWGPYVHNNCCNYGFEIWEANNNYNYYVKANDKCRNAAEEMGLTPLAICN